MPYIAVLKGSALRLVCWLDLCHMVVLQADLQRLLSQEASLKQQIATMQERQAAAERARAGDRAFLQVWWCAA
jgi:cell division protein FtsB